MSGDGMREDRHSVWEANPWGRSQTPGGEGAGRGKPRQVSRLRPGSIRAHTPKSLNGTEDQERPRGKRIQAHGRFDAPTNRSPRPSRAVTGRWRRA